MNTRHLLIIALIVASGLTACSNDDENENPLEEVKITTSVNRASDALPTKAVIDPVTGAGNLENGDVITLHYISEEAGLGSGDEFFTLGTSKLYWNNIANRGNPPFTFAASYPVFRLFGDFNAATATNPDLLTAKVTGLNKGEDVNLVFNHVMHRLNVNLTSDYYHASQLANASVTLQNLKSSVFIHLYEGPTFPHRASGDDPYPSQTGASTSFIVAPQDLTQGADWIQISLEGKTYTYKVPEKLKPGDNPAYPRRLESGKILSLSLKLTKNDVSGSVGEDFTGGGGYTDW